MTFSVAYRDSRLAEISLRVYQPAVERHFLVEALSPKKHDRWLHIFPYTLGLDDYD